MAEKQTNVLGTELELCGLDPVTGFYRDGCCNTGPDDVGTHTVCAIVDEAFLEFSKRMGNDLITPRPEYQFVGLKDGDNWCLCAMRWEQARRAGYAPKVRLRSTHEKTLEYVSLEHLKQHQVDLH
ncbi:MAG: DUF2237 domain-containing protein [Alphaproteobacteria bacterium]|jgi:hypothetical protein|nr:DUF2237 domain-containing protein [Alphaproteobacteria bacterium]